MTAATPMNDAEHRQPPLAAWFFGRKRPQRNLNTSSVMLVTPGPGSFISQRINRIEPGEACQMQDTIQRKALRQPRPRRQKHCIY